MLVVVAGASGNIGQELIDSLHARGHQVRGLGRNPSKISDARRAKLHDFVVSKTHYDIEALDKACKGADAVISALSPGSVELQFDAQLLLLRAAERAGIRRFVVGSWNNDWSRDPLGLHESYDPYIALRRLAEISSPIKPIYVFTGVFAEVFWAFPGQEYFTQQWNGVWDPETKSMSYWGTGDEKWPWASWRDSAEFTAAIIGRDDAVDGGYWNTVSGLLSVKQFAAAYTKAKGQQVTLKCNGSIEDLRKTALKAREQSTPLKYYEYIGYFYQLYTIDGTWDMKKIDNDKFPDVKATSMEDFLKGAPV